MKIDKKGKKRKKIGFYLACAILVGMFLFSIYFMFNLSNNKTGMAHYLGEATFIQNINDTINESSTILLDINEDYNISSLKINAISSGPGHVRVYVSDGMEKKLVYDTNDEK